MSRIHYNLKHKEILDTFLFDSDYVKPGKMFGYPAYYVGGKLFASLYLDGVCVKLPETSVQELIRNKDYFPFEPMGRKMQEWIFITHKNSKEYLNDKAIFKKSIEYVASLTNFQLDSI